MTWPARWRYVPGGWRGLGLQMASALGDMGAKVAITARKADELAEAKSHLEGRGIDVLTVTNDLSDAGGIPALVDAVVAPVGASVVDDPGAGPRARRRRIIRPPGARS